MEQLMILEVLVMMCLVGWCTTPLIAAAALSSNIRVAGAPPRIAVVGGGWAGWGAAKALCEAGAEVTLLDALPDPTGAKPQMTPTGKPFEPGQRGFWFDYPNIESLVQQLGLRESDVFTSYLNSTFYSPFGVEATAPVFSESAFPTLPSPLGQILATFQLFERLPLQDRVTMAGLLYGMLDMYRDEHTFSAYDRMTAHELFIRLGLSKRLVDDFLRPTLLIGLFKAPEELSAAVVMELLYFYALAHQSSFDVRWIKRGTVANCIFAPLSERLISEYNLQVLGGCRVERIELTDAATESSAASVTALKYSKRLAASTSGSSPLQQQQQQMESGELRNLDAVVLALGANGMKSVLRGSPELASLSPQLSSAASLGSIDCISCRVWLDREVPTRTPANVFSRFEELRGSGGTFFMLDQLQKDNLAELWGASTVSTDAENAANKGSVVAVDFYNSGALMALSDQEIVRSIKEKLLPACVPSFRAAKIVDSFVQRYSGAVTWFSPGSYEKRPRTIVKEVENLCCAGDWVVMTSDVGTSSSRSSSGPTALLDEVPDFLSGEHGAKGLCQERAYVSGLLAANTLLQRLERDQLRTPEVQQQLLKKAEILPVRDDELQVKLGRAVNRRVLKALSRLGIRNPWLR